MPFYEKIKRWFYIKMNILQPRTMEWSNISEIKTKEGLSIYNISYIETVPHFYWESKEEHSIKWNLYSEDGDNWCYYDGVVYNEITPGVRFRTFKKNQVIKQQQESFVQKYKQLTK